MWGGPVVCFVCDFGGHYQQLHRSNSEFVWDGECSFSIVSVGVVDHTAIPVSWRFFPWPPLGNPRRLFVYVWIPGSIEAFSHDSELFGVFSSDVIYYQPRWLRCQSVPLLQLFDIAIFLVSDTADPFAVFPTVRGIFWRRKNTELNQKHTIPSRCRSSTYSFPPDQGLGC